MTEAQIITAESMAAGEDARGAAYAAHRAGLPGAGQPWLDALRDRAMNAFTRTGLPTRRLEDWKYVDLRALAETAGNRLVPPARSRLRNCPGRSSPMVCGSCSSTAVSALTSRRTWTRSLA